MSDVAHCRPLLLRKCNTSISPVRRLLAWFPVTLPPAPPHLGFKWISHPTSTGQNHRHANESPATIRARSFPRQINRCYFLFSAGDNFKFCVIYLFLFFFPSPVNLWLRLCFTEWLEWGAAWLIVFYGLLIRRLRSRWLILPTVPSRPRTACAREVADSRRFCLFLL